jgi:hypothetical protein
MPPTVRGDNIAREIDFTNFGVYLPLNNVLKCEFINYSN